MLIAREKQPQTRCQEIERVLLHVVNQLKVDTNKARNQILTYGGLARFTESVVCESFHEAGFADTAGADNNYL